MSELDLARGEIADRLGIGGRYRSAFGEEVSVAAEVRQAVATALGFASATAAEAAESLHRLEARRNALLAPLDPVEADVPVQIGLRGPVEAAVEWRLVDENGAVREGRSAPGTGLALPPLPAGYFQLTATAGSRSAEATLIAAPARCWSPAAGRRWGVSAPVYGLSSERGFGIGSYADIGELAAGAAARGADLLGLSPLHALFAADRQRISPYSPSSRLFLETLFIEPRAVDGFGGRAAALTEAARARLAGLRDGPLVDHAAVWAIKRPILDALWTDFRAGGGSADFEAFRSERGDLLDAHATFEALSEVLPSQGYAQHEWPQVYRQRSSEAVARFRRKHDDLVAFHAWLQWLADRQLKAAAAKARSGGMALGLYLDLAVGADRAGSELWSAPERFAAGLAVGAPPDALAPQGQDWGLPPVHPIALEEQGLAVFRALVAANLRHAGAIRIDHAFQLRRLYLIPAGDPASAGAYVDYPMEAMLAVLRVESHRAKAMVIAEDLGTAPPGFAETLAANGILSYRVLYFEREWNGSFRAPPAYPGEAIAVINTHDVATLAGWWRGQDILDRARYGIMAEERTEDERRGRADEIRRLMDLLVFEGLAAPGDIPAEPPVEAIVRLLARTSCRLVSVQSEDLLGVVESANIPGTVDGPPNWRRRLPATVTELVRADGPLDRLAAAMRAEGREQ